MSILRSFRPFFILILALLGSNAFAASVALPKKENFHVFLLAGQSNMAGRGTLPAKPKSPHPRILMLTKSGEWVPAIHPIHFDKEVAGVGLGMSFARTLVEQDSNITVGLVPAACGGSPIDTWQPGAYWHQTKSHPFDDAIARVHTAQKSGVLKGILWHQGESDATQERAEPYEQKLEDLLRRFRTTLDQPDLAVVIGQLAQFPKRGWDLPRHIVNRAHVRVSWSDPYTNFVHSAGLKDTQDNLHFDTPSLVKFGERYAASYLRLKQAKQP